MTSSGLHTTVSGPNYLELVLNICVCTKVQWKMGFVSYPRSPERRAATINDSNQYRWALGLTARTIKVLRTSTRIHKVHVARAHKGHAAGALQAKGPSKRLDTNLGCFYWE